MVFTDPELEYFVSQGAELNDLLKIKPNKTGYINNKGAKIWYSTYGKGFPVILLHGGRGQSGNWIYQVPALIKADFLVILIDSRGHGHSTRDKQPYTYELMASDVIEVIEYLHLDKVSAVGWSDGAIISMILAMQIPDRIAGVFSFGVNMDPSGVKDIQEETITLQRCFKKIEMDYKSLSTTPDDYNDFKQAIHIMQQTEPNYTPDQLKTIKTPVLIVLGEFDEFIKKEHNEYLVKTIPTARLLILSGVSHFAPLQKPDYFNKHLLEFLEQMVY